MYELTPVIRDYAWGSHTAIAELQGRPSPAPGPEAELWMGAHPGAPSSVVDGRTDARTLDRLIATDPGRHLGERVRAQFGDRLPFLLKVLAADKALSIQVHPNRDQAEAGFRGQLTATPDGFGIPPNYTDDWPKPEILCALTPFEVLAGFREPGEAARLLTALEVPTITALVADLGSPAEPRTLATLLGQLLALDESGAVLTAALASCRRLASSGHPDSLVYHVALGLHEDHPRDLGVLASMLLRHQVLPPGHALFMDAGGLHAYIRGVGVELMSNSDNVLRAGLTGKHIDVPELLRIADPTVGVPIISARELGCGVAVFDTPVPEFRLFTADLTTAPVPAPGSGPRIVLCIEGEAHLERRDGAEHPPDPACRDKIDLVAGQSAFLSASEEMITLSGTGRLFVATTGL